MKWSSISTLVQTLVEHDERFDNSRFAYVGRRVIVCALFVGLCFWLFFELLEEEIVLYDPHGVYEVLAPNYGPSLDTLPTELLL